MDQNGLKILRAELQGDMEILSTLESKYEAIHRKLDAIVPDEFDYAALAYTIVNIYNLMENYFHRVAKRFENNLDDREWHRDLVKRMALEIEDVRPAVIQKREIPIFDELRSFRHVFRHIYMGELDRNKLLSVDARLSDAIDIFRKNHQKFSTYIDDLIRIESGSF